MKNKNVLRLLVLAIFFSLFMLAACSNASDTDVEDSVVGEPGVGGAGVSIGHIDSEFIGNYIFLSERIDLPEYTYETLGISVHEENLYYWYVDSNHNLVVVTITPDGDIVRETYIPLQEGLIQIGGLQITENDHYEAIISIRDDNGNITVIYGEYNQQGEAVTTQDLSHIVSQGGFMFHLDEAIITEDGNIAIVVVEGGHAQELYLLSGEGALLGQLQLNFNENIIRLKDGRVVALLRDGTSSSLREIDFVSGDWGETLSLSVTNAQRLLPADAIQPYDLLIDDGNYLIGYNLDTAIQTPILNFLEVRIISTSDYHMGFLPDGRFFALTTDHLPGGRFGDWFTELYVFAPTQRGDMQDVQIITLGGMRFDPNMRREVVAFNSRNQYYQIQLIEYAADEDWDAAQLRFQIDMVTNRGPDIILNPRFAPIDASFMVDLNPLIDADPVINRTDFFPNILDALTAHDGTIPFISAEFWIETMVTTQDSATQITPLTFESLLRRLDEDDDPHLFGDWILRDTFLINFLFYSGDNFIDRENNRANLDSDAFIQLLELASRLPEEPRFGDTLMAEEISRLHSGEQLLYHFFFSGSSSIRHMFGMLGDDIVVTGMPTPTGGRHVIQFGDSIGINAGSPHQEAAWSFIRGILLPDTYIRGGLPLRIDLFEAEIAFFMIQILWEESIPELGIEEGDEWVPQIHMGDVVYYERALTEDQAAMTQGIVESADMFLQYDETIAMIIREDSQAFFTGIRSAEDTVRIMQNRVQIYLDERG